MLLRKKPGDTFEKFRREFFATVAQREYQNAHTGYYHLREQPGNAGYVDSSPRKCDMKTTSLLNNMQKEEICHKNDRNFESCQRLTEKQCIAARKGRITTRFEAEVDARLRDVRSDPMKKRQFHVLLDIHDDSSKFDAVYAYRQQDSSRRMRRHFQMRRLRIDAALIRRNAIIQAESERNEAIRRGKETRRPQNEVASPGPEDAAPIRSWLTIVAIACFTLSVRERRRGVNAHFQGDAKRLKNSCRSMQAMWRRKKTAARERVFRRDASRAAAWCGKKWRLKMRKRRIWALRVLRDFLDDNRRFSALRQVAKDLMRATRCLQSFVRGFNACTAARMLALTQLWIKVEAEMVSHSEKEIERRFKARRVDIIALTGKTRVCSFDHFIVASFLEDLEREQDEMKRALKVHPVVREKVLSVYLADKRLHFKSTTEEILSGMEDKLRPVLTIDDAKAMISNNENSSGVVGVANQYVDTFSKKRKKRATRLPDATLKMRLYSGTGKACMQNLIRSARNTSISSDRVADRSSRASLLRQRQTLRRPSRPISSSRGTTRISSRPAQPARSFERMSSRPLN